MGATLNPTSEQAAYTTIDPCLTPETVTALAVPQTVGEQLLTGTQTVFPWKGNRLNSPIGVAWDGYIRGTLDICPNKQLDGTTRWNVTAAGTYTHPVKLETGRRASMFTRSDITHRPCLNIEPDLLTC